jgi:dTDP-4-amino-4,6-dideoxygalactose transaminase
VPFARPWLDDDDRAAVLRTLEGHVLTHGPEGKAFETEFAAFLGDGAHCVSVSSCMAALHVACLHFGFGPGDDVLVAAETHVATAHAVEWVGATPRFVDCEPRSGNVTAAALEAAITERTRGILLVHFVGIPCELPAIAGLARERGLVLIEDCALAVGARLDGTHVGLFGDAGCFSFYPVKHITTAEGGMFVSRHPDVAERVARLRAFGVDRKHDERAFPGMYDVPSLGLNYRLSEPQAALGRSQLRRIGANLARRRENFELLRDALDGVEGARLLDGDGNSHYCASLVLPRGAAARRHELLERLARAGVGTSIYYPQPVPRMSYYAERYGYDAALFPNAEEISDRSMALPVGPHLDPDDVRYVAESVRVALQEVAA